MARTLRVEVFRRDDPAGAREKIYEYQRNYRMLQTFEPFRQGSRSFALMSSDYTRTSVLDLDTGRVIAEEPADSGFCPVGFYVPDRWDVHHYGLIPGSPSWNADYAAARAVLAERIDDLMGEIARPNPAGCEGKSK